jgi:hypothetical protein
VSGSRSSRTLGGRPCKACGTAYDSRITRTRGTCSEACLFWSHVAKGGADDCWPWTGGRNADGYGVFHMSKTSTVASRRAFELTSGPIQAGLYVLHRCDNPPCCNPAHLFAGTLLDNNRDRERKGRGRYLTGDAHPARKHPETRARGDRHGSRLHPERLRRGEAASAAKLTEEAVIEIRAKRAAGKTYPELAAQYGVSITLIGNVCRGKAWAHVW